MFIFFLVELLSANDALLSVFTQYNERVDTSRADSARHEGSAQQSSTTATTTTTSTTASTGALLDLDQEPAHAPPSYGNIA